jgi:hypothetical protein
MIERVYIRSFLGFSLRGEKPKIYRAKGEFTEVYGLTVWLAFNEQFLAQTEMVCIIYTIHGERREVEEE